MLQVGSLATLYHLIVATSRIVLEATGGLRIFGTLVGAPLRGDRPLSTFQNDPYNSATEVGNDYRLSWAWESWFFGVVRGGRCKKEELLLVGGYTFLWFILLWSAHQPEL